MILQYAILGFLSRSSLTGYQLGKIFDRCLNFAWAASLSQIYRELGTLERNGLITSRLEKQEDRPDKKIYTITEEGKKSFTAWIKKYPEEILAEKRDEFMLRIFFGSSMGKEELKNHFKHFLEERHKIKNEFQKFSNNSMEKIKNLNITEPAGIDKICVEFLIRRARMSTDLLIQWAEECMAELEKIQF